MQQCDYTVPFIEEGDKKKKKKISLWFVVQSEFSQKWEGPCGVWSTRHTSLSGEDKVFPNEDLLGFLLLPDAIDVHFIPARDTLARNKTLLL